MKRIYFTILVVFAVMLCSCAKDPSYVELPEDMSSAIPDDVYYLEDIIHKDYPSVTFYDAVALNYRFSWFSLRHIETNYYIDDVFIGKSDTTSDNRFISYLTIGRYLDGVEHKLSVRGKILNLRTGDIYERESSKMFNYSAVPGDTMLVYGIVHKIVDGRSTLYVDSVDVFPAAVAENYKIKSLQFIVNGQTFEGTESNHYSFNCVADSVPCRFVIDATICSKSDPSKEKKLKSSIVYS